MQAVEFASLRRKPFQNRYGRASERYTIDNQLFTEGSISPTKYRCGKIMHVPNLLTDTSMKNKRIRMRIS